MLALQEILENDGVWTGCPNSRDYKTIIGNFQIEFCRLPFGRFLGILWRQFRSVGNSGRFCSNMGKQSWAPMKRWDMIFRADQLREKFHGARAKVKSFRSLSSKLHTARLWKKVIISKWPCKMGSAQSQTLRFCISTISNFTENRQVDTMYHLPTTMCSEQTTPNNLTITNKVMIGKNFLYNDCFWLVFTGRLMADAWCPLIIEFRSILSSESIQSIHQNYQGFWPMNLHTSPSFNVGGGEGDHNSGGFLKTKKTEVYRLWVFFAHEIWNLKSDDDF